MLIPILGLNTNRERKIIRPTKVGIARQFGDNYHKRTNIKSLPPTPLPLRTSYSNNDLFIADKAISVFRRSKDHYYKWIFTYEADSNSDSLILKNIEIDENNSKFLFSIKYKIIGCDIEFGKE